MLTFSAFGEAIKMTTSVGIVPQAYSIEIPPSVKRVRLKRACYKVGSQE